MSDGTSLTLSLQNLLPRSEVPLPAPTATVQSLPPELPELTPNTRIPAQVVSTSPEGELRVSIPQGDVQLQVQPNQLPSLSAGSDVTLQVLRPLDGQQVVRVQVPQTSLQSQQGAPQTQSAQPLDQTVIQNTRAPVQITATQRLETLQPLVQNIIQQLGDPQPRVLEPQSVVRLLPIDNVPNLQRSFLLDRPVVTNSQIQNTNFAATTILNATFIEPDFSLRPLQNIFVNSSNVQNGVQNLTQATIQGGLESLQAVTPQTSQNISILTQNTFSPPVFQTEFLSQTIVSEPRILPRVSNPVLSLNNGLSTITANVTAISGPTLSAPSLGLGEEISLTQIGGDQSQLRLSVAQISQALVQTNINAEAVPVTQNIQPQIQPSQVGIDQVLGVVTSFTQDVFPVVTILAPSGDSIGEFIINSPAQNVTIGTSIVFDTNGAGLGILPQASATLQASVQNPLPALDQILQQVLNLSPTQSQSIQSAILPSIPQAASPPQLSASTLFLIAALSGGEVKNFLSDRATQGLNKAKISFERLGQEFGQMQRSFSDVPLNEWRNFSIPLLTQEHITGVQFHYRDETGEFDSENEKQKATRFVMDLNMTRMGEIQVDGLVRDKRMDVTLRTEKNLSDAMRQQLRGLYASAIESAGYEGDISFRGDPSEMLVFKDK